MNVRELKQILSHVQNEDREVVLFADGRIFKLHGTQSYDTDKGSFYELGGGWADIDIGEIE